MRPGMSSSATTRRVWVSLLVALLIGVQMLALLHRVAHDIGDHARPVPRQTGAAMDAGRNGAVSLVPVTERGTGGVTDCMSVANIGGVADDASSPFAIRGWLTSLFADHVEGSIDCHLYDQLLHADAAVPGFAVPPVVALIQTPATPGELPIMAAQAAGYLARGPPLIA
ncbi:hypothetical protein BH09PSE5_BH09PSE5_35270 [soil metagenome]